jgi:hypothetical protein
MNTMNSGMAYASGELLGWKLAEARAAVSIAWPGNNWVGTISRSPAVYAAGEQVRNQLRTLYYIYRTEQQYLFWVRRFILFHGKRHPAEMAAAEIEAFLTYLAVDRQVSASTQNQALAALLFLYQKFLRVELPWLDGIVRSGMGGKDRSAILPDALVAPLQTHLVSVKTLHRHAIEHGYAGLELPHALERKYPNAHLECGWQYVFPAKRPSRDPRSGAWRRHSDLYARHVPGRERRAESVGSLRHLSRAGNPEPRTASLRPGPLT